ncbi:MAG: immunoglobulin domain-containing protein [Erysipelotrichales bacterium]|nr:immunoglobulin domain-containing protein [Erysipelotrichales bacterium]
MNTTYAITADPTCEGTGVGTYTATFTNTRFSTQTRNVDIAATGHHYEFTKWEWTGSDEDGYTKAEVILTCKNNTDHIVRVNADITKESTDADCTTPGTVVYTAAAEFEGQKYNDSKTVTSAALGHDYELKEWIWNGFESASAKFVCANDPTHIVTVEATITSKTVNATCTEDGSVVYTAKVTFEEKEYSDDKTEVLPKLGHQYEKGEWTWEGYTKASLQFVCEHNPEHVQNVSATITSERTEPTCTEDGTVVYTAKVTFEGKDYTDSKTEVLPKLNHDYELTGWEWTEFSAAKATFTCKNNPSHTVVEDAVITSRTQDPECEKAGATVYTATVSFNEKTYTDERSVSIPATGHDYEVSEWIWSGNETEGYHTASAVLVCKNDQTHTKTVAASLELDTKEATCTEAGYTIYTATAEEGEKTFTDEKTVNHPALGHAYKLTKWEWEGSDEEGYTSATATFVCEHDDKHVETVKDEEIDITVDEDGVIEYKAIVTFEEKDYSDVKSVKTDELEHDYEVVDWEWTGSDADGYTAAKVNLVCKNNPLHTKTLDAVVSHDTQDPSCTEDGKTVYTATAVYAGKTYTDTKEVAIAATGHDYVLTGWNWEEDFSAASVTFTCKNDAAHKQTVNAEITLKRTEPDCETDGKIVYTAKAVFEGKEYGDTREKTLPALGHAYEFKGFTWNGYESASAKFVCGHDESHVQEVSAAITSATTKPTCTEDGKVVYTAKVTFEGKDYTDSKTEVLPALGHKYEKGEWTWEGYTKASLQFVCEHNPEHVQNVSATITSERTEPTCTEDGMVVYTAKVTFEGKDYTDIKEETLAKLGHKWGEPAWTWAEDASSAKAKFVCEHDETHVQELNAEIEESVKVEATYEQDGVKLYTASVELEGETYTDTMELPYTIVSEAPIIIEHPSDVTLRSGTASAVFKVVAKGEGLSYQWYYRKSSTGTWAKSTAACATTDTYTLPASSVVSARSGYQYRCEVTNLRGSATSNEATLTVTTTPKPVIIEHPESVTIRSGHAVSFKVVAEGENLKYQWYYRTSADGVWSKSTATCATTDTYSLPASSVVSSRNGYQYRCVVSNKGGSVTSDTATLTVTTTAIPVIIEQPKSQSVKPGTAVSFTVIAEGENLTYQWYYRTSSTGTWAKSTATCATTNTYSLPASSVVKARNGYEYRCVVTNKAGSVTSKAAALTIILADKPVIVKSPESVTVTAGTAVNFTVEATGEGLEYQWYYRTSSTGTWSKSTASCANTPTYTLEAAKVVKSRSGYEYRCLVKNEGGFVYSEAAVLTITPVKNVWKTLHLFRMIEWAQ